jgi:hypothetical protein
MEEARPKHRRRLAVRVAILTLVLFLLAGISEVLHEESCGYSEVAWQRTWKWAAYPHWVCEYADGRSQTVYWWDNLK